MRNFKCQDSSCDDDHIYVDKTGMPGAVAFMHTTDGGSDASIFLIREDAAELGRYLIQLAEGGE